MISSDGDVACIVDSGSLRMQLPSSFTVRTHLTTAMSFDYPSPAGNSSGILVVSVTPRIKR